MLVSQPAIPPAAPWLWYQFASESGLEEGMFGAKTQN